VTLPAWQLAIIESGELYRVGGAVRDRLLGIGDVPDTDFLVRGIEPARFEEILARYGRVAYVGKTFGVYRFTPHEGGAPCDIAFPRTETSTGPGHREFSVRTDWTLPVEDDLRRRDFTINAIAERVPGGERVDPFGGEADLSRRRLRTIFPEAFVEDPLRILRGARFRARFDLEPEADTLDRMRESALLLSTVSAERVQDEATKTLTQCAVPSRCFDLLHDVGGLAVVLPELDRCFGVTQNEYHPDDVYWHSLKTCDAAPRSNLLVRWAALLHDTGKVDARQIVRDQGGERVVFYGHELVSEKIAAEVLERLRYPRAIVADCCRLVREHMFRYDAEWKPATLRRFMGRVGIEHLDDLFALREADCRSRSLTDELALLGDLRRRAGDELRSRAILRVTDLAIDGRVVMQVLGVGPGCQGYPFRRCRGLTLIPQKRSSRYLGQELPYAGLPAPVNLAPGGTRCQRFCFMDH
jgi:poly(A) polymerase/tRNA nucleotidyltransferase (CCA-adding enzyme)